MRSVCTAEVTGDWGVRGSEPSHRLRGLFTPPSSKNPKEPSAPEHGNRPAAAMRAVGGSGPSLSQAVMLTVAAQVRQKQGKEAKRRPGGAALSAGLCRRLCEMGSVALGTAVSRRLNGLLITHTHTHTHTCVHAHASASLKPQNGLRSPCLDD